MAQPNPELFLIENIEGIFASLDAVQDAPKSEAEVKVRETAEQNLRFFLDNVLLRLRAEMTAALAER